MKFKKDQRVSHPKFGKGTFMYYDDDGVWVNFDHEKLGEMLTDPEQLTLDELSSID